MPSRRSGEQTPHRGATEAVTADLAPPTAPAVARLLSLQGTAGNAAVARVVLARDLVDGGTPDAGVRTDAADTGAGGTDAGATAGAAGAATQTATAGAGAGIAAAISARDVGAIKAIGDWSGATAAQRTTACEILLDQFWVGPRDEWALERIWASFGPGEAQAQIDHASLWARCVDRGAELRRCTAADTARIRVGTRPDVMTAHQAGRVAAGMDAMSAADFTALRRTLEAAHSDMARWFLYKATAAGRSAADIEAFRITIDGQDDAWLLSNLGVVQEDVAAGGQVQTGIRQQWQMACGATTVQIIHGETDPIYALTLQQGGNVNPADQSNATVTNEQQSIMAGHGVTATPIGTAGSGLWVESDLNALSGQTGVTYAYTGIAGTPGANPATGAMATAIDEIVGHLGRGVHVPLLIGGAAGQTSHYVTAVRATGGSLLVHDPGNGTTAWVTRAMILSNQLAGPLSWNFLVGFDRPSA